jgi:hypothetical protein
MGPEYLRMGTEFDLHLLPRLDESLAEVTPSTGSRGCHRQLLDSALRRYELIQRQYESLRSIAPRLARDYLQGEVHGAVAQVGNYFDLWNESVFERIPTDCRTRHLRDTIHARLNRTRQTLEQARVTGCTVEALPAPVRLPQTTITLSRMPVPEELSRLHSPESCVLKTALDCFDITRSQYESMVSSETTATRVTARLYLATDVKRGFWRVEKRYQAWVESRRRPEAKQRDLEPSVEDLAASLESTRYVLWRCTWGAQPATEIEPEFQAVLPRARAHVTQHGHGHSHL